MAKLTNLQKLSLDIVSNKVEKYSATEANDVLRNAIFEAMGTQEFDIYAFQENKYKVFKILSETITIAIAKKIIDRYESWVDIKDVALGDIAEFKMMNNDLFKVGYVSHGNLNIRRQRLVNGKIPMVSYPMAVKVYEEFALWITGRIDWNELVNRTADSIDNKIAEEIINQIETAYNGLDAEFVKSGSYDEAKLTELVQLVEAKTGQKAVIYGTKKALSKVKVGATVIAEADKNDIRNHGFVTVVAGTKVVEIPQTLTADNKFALADDMLFIIPDGTKVVKLAFEGDAFVQESTEGRLDQQIEYLITRKVQLGTAKASYYGVYHSIV